MELEVQKYLRSGKTFADLKTELGIEVREWNGKLVNLNYNQIDSPKTHPIVMECRQLVLELGTWNCIHRSFARFFNYGEALNLAQDFNYEKTVALSKIDGSIIGLFFYENQWLMTTRGVIEGDCQVGTFPITFRELFHKTASQYPNFWKTVEIYRNDGSCDYCYTFELTSPENQVVVSYPERSLHLLTVRDRKQDFIELSLKVVQVIGHGMGVKLPTTRSFTNIGALVQMASELTDLAEGFVCVDYSRPVNGSYLRMKVKNPAYLAVAHLKDSVASSLRSLLQLTILGEAGEFLAYFPAYTHYIEGLRTKWEEYRLKMATDLSEAAEKKKLSRKEYALWAQSNCINPGVMFQYLDGKITTVKDWVDSLVKEKGIKNFGKIMMQTLKIKDVEWGETSIN